MSRMTRTAQALAASAVASIAFAQTASAHVHVSPDTASVGSYPTLTFRVPTESATASTTSFEIDFPLDHPFGSVSYQPVPGWSATVTKTHLAKPITTDDGSITEAPSKIVWTADKDAAIKPGQYQTFSVVAGAVPDTGKVTFTAHQTYSDGSTVNWDQTQTGKTEPENPAPVLYIKDKSPDAEESSTSPTSETTSTDKTARLLGTIGLIVGAVGLLGAGAAFATRKRTR